jgi:hypothetical protein
MLSVLLGLSLSLHLMTYQDGMSHLQQTLTTSDLKVCYVDWSWQNDPKSSL